jgi:deoxyribodipyrimidine photo-lyase
MTTPTLLWFRRDLRLADHAALLAAVNGGSGSADGDVLGVFVADDRLLRPSGAPRRAFLAGCLTRLSESTGGKLLIVKGSPDSVVPRIAAAAGAAAVHVSADFMPYGRRRDELVAEALRAKDIELVATGSPYAVAPGRVRKPDGSRYAVFTPYFRGWTEHGWRAPAVTGDDVSWVDPADIDAIGGRRMMPEDLGIAVPDGLELPEPGEQAAAERWKQFLADAVGEYDDERDRPDHPGTSRMSPYLKWGCIHPRTMLADLARLRSKGAAAYRRELAWREFYADLVFHRPESLRQSIDPVVDEMTWDQGAEADARLADWQQGRTGYPYIDAGMRQLLTEGWMHNRVRMGVASFLIKDLHVPWQRGAAHFLRHLVDGDVSSNNHGWQWVAGSGPQAAPFFRIFNPVGQGEKHDPDGDYVRRYVPELRSVAGKAVHRPWELPGGLPNGYPERIVDHAAERAESLQRWEDRPRR